MANAFGVVIFVGAVFGALHLLAISHPSARLSRIWITLGF